MSFILDALRKSEHERQRSALPGLAQIPVATPQAQLPRWALVVIGVLAAAVLTLCGAWWLSARAPAELTAELPGVERALPLPPPMATTSPAAPPRVVPQASTPPERVAPARESALAAAVTPTDAAAVPAAPSFSPPAAPSADEIALPSAAALAAEGIVLPALHLELLRFREQPSDRFVFINGRKYGEGERLVEGPQLVSISPTGAVLLHAGRRFLLVSE